MISKKDYVVPYLYTFQLHLYAYSRSQRADQPRYGQPILGRQNFRPADLWGVIHIRTKCPINYDLYGQSVDYGAQ